MSETQQLSDQSSGPLFAPSLQPSNDPSAGPLSEQLSALIDDIYAAALDRSLWADVLRRTAEFVCDQVGAQAVLAYDAAHKDAPDKPADVHDEFGVDPHFAPLQPEQYARLEPAASTLLLLGSGPAAGPTDIPDDECPATQSEPHAYPDAYNEWAEPQGFADCVHGVLDKWATGGAQMSLVRHQASALLDDGTRARMRLIVPHLRRAMIIGNVIELRRTEAATLLDLVDGLSAAMFLVSAGGRIVHANASGHAMLAQGSLLRVAAGRLTTADAPAEQALDHAMTGDLGGDAAGGVKSTPVPLRARDGDRYVAHVLPLACIARARAGISCEAAAAVLVHKPAVETGISQEVIGKHYKLSRTELRVLLAFVQLDTVNELAAALGIVVSTAKTHLHRVFTKTGARRKADLVKLVAGYASPIVN